MYDGREWIPAVSISLYPGIGDRIVQPALSPARFVILQLISALSTVGFSPTRNIMIAYSRCIDNQCVDAPCTRVREREPFRISCSPFFFAHRLSTTYPFSCLESSSLESPFLASPGGVENNLARQSRVLSSLSPCHHHPHIPLLGVQ